MFHIYLRVSSDKQADSKAGMNAQLDTCIQWCENNGEEWSHDVAHDDAGVKSQIHPFDRQGFGELMKTLQEGDCIVVAKRDRIARDRLMLCLLERDLEKDGIKIIDASGSWNGDSPEDKLIKNIMDSLAEYERELIRKRTKLGLAAKKRRGEAYCASLYGYKNIDGQLVEDDYQQHVLIDMRHYRNDLEWSYRQIADKLNQNGIAPPRGKQWYPGTVSSILKREEEKS